MKRGRPRLWVGEKLERLRLAYRSDMKLWAVAQDFGISSGVISKIAARHGWPRRRRGRWNAPVEATA